MAWSESRIFRSLLQSALGGGSSFDLGGSPLRVALFDNTITPDRDAAPADAAYGEGVWVAGAEVADDPGWDVGGPALTGQSWDALAGGITQLNANPVESDEGTTLVDVYGDLLYVGADGRGVAFHYFGGPQAVTNGVFSVVPHDEEGLIRFTV